MKNAAIVLDSWKLPLFERNLKAAGYKWKRAPGITPKTVTLRVEYEDIQALALVVGKAESESQHGRKNPH